MAESLAQQLRIGVMAAALLASWTAGADAAGPPEEKNLNRAEEIFRESLRSDDLERNRRYLQEILDLAPNSPYGHFSRGWFYAEEEKFPQAIDEYSEAVIEKPDFNEARHNLASAYFYSGQFPMAIREYRKVLELNPLWAEAHLNLGTAYFMEEQPFLAISEYEEALRLNPQLAVTHYYIGLVLDKMERWGEAHAQYSAFIQKEKGEDYREYSDRARNRLEELWVLLGRQAT